MQEGNDGRIAFVTSGHHGGSVVGNLGDCTIHPRGGQDGSTRDELRSVDGVSRCQDLCFSQFGSLCRPTFPSRTASSHLGYSSSDYSEHGTNTACRGRIYHQVNYKADNKEASCILLRLLSSNLVESLVSVVDGAPSTNLVLPKAQVNQS